MSTQTDPWCGACDDWRSHCWHANPKLVTAERAREIIDAGGSVHRSDRYSGDYRYIVDRMPPEPPEGSTP